MAVDADSNGDLRFVSSNVDQLIDSWVLDSTCLFHMTRHKDWFDTYRLVNCGSVLMENNVVCKVVGIGTIIVKMFDNAMRTLKDVRHVLDLKKNLISLGTLDSNGFS